MARIHGMRLLALISLVCAAPSPAQLPDPLEVAQGQQAVQLLDRAAAGLGGGRLLEVDAIDVDYAGTAYWLHQGPTPDQPAVFEFRHRNRYDWQQDLSLAQRDFRGAELTFDQRRAYPPHRQEERLILVAASPHAVVRELLSRPADLLLLDQGAAGASLRGVLHGRTVKLSLGPDQLPRSLAYFIEEDLNGDSTLVVDWLDYAPVNGWMVPRRIVQREAGRTTYSLALNAFAAAAPVPDWAKDLRPRPAQAEETPAGLRAVELAPGIHWLRGFDGGDYHGMLVELDEGLMVLEAPRAIGNGDELARVAASLSPKRFIYVAPTHHHEDHSKGAAALTRRGATVMTTQGNVDFFTTMAGAPRLFGGLGAGAANPEIRILAPDERIGPVQFLDAGPTGHAEEHLIFWFPDHRILFHSDMGRFNDDGSVEPARPQTCRLLEFINSRRLDVDRIVSGHGRMGTLDDLRRAVATEGSACLDPKAAAARRQ